VRIGKNKKKTGIPSLEMKKNQKRVFLQPKSIIYEE